MKTKRENKILTRRKLRRILNNMPGFISGKMSVKRLMRSGWGDGTIAQSQARERS